MNRVEKDFQIKAIEKLTDIFTAGHRFKAMDICKIHKVWLGDIYEWAGEYRHVKMSKDDFSFAFPEQIPKLMTGLEKGPLHQYTPCTFKSHEKIIKALAIVHTELIIIHPFREGNGRIARMLATLMALQAGLPPLDFRLMTSKGKKKYIRAVQAGMMNNYIPMEKVFAAVIQATLRVRRLI